MPLSNLLIVDRPSRWKLAADAVEVVSARDYLSLQRFQSLNGARVFNLCRSYSYQSIGYYVSLLAEARGHRAIPTVSTLRDFKSSQVARSMGEEIDEVIQSALRKVEGELFSLEVYFGQSLDPQLSNLAARLYRLFSAPLLKFKFSRNKKWMLVDVAPLPIKDLPAEHLDRLEGFAASYFKRRGVSKPPKQRYLYDLAIVRNPTEAAPPSDDRAIELFTEAAREVGFYVEIINTSDGDRVGEFDALFIRETTAVNHPTYRISRLAHAEGLIVIDDPWSILRSTNKIYLAESLRRAKIPAPETHILTRADFRKRKWDSLTFPCVVKQPDGAFSLGVRKADNPDELVVILAELFKESELLLTQAFAPSEYDWRIGVLDNQPLYACKYFMAKGHWQIYNWKAGKEDDRSGNVETLHVEFAPGLWWKQPPRPPGWWETGSMASTSSRLATKSTSSRSTTIPPSNPVSKTGLWAWNSTAASPVLFGDGSSTRAPDPAPCPSHRPTLVVPQGLVPSTQAGPRERADSAAAGWPGRVRPIRCHRPQCGSV